MKLKLVFYPSFSDRQRLSEYVYRASWYLFPFRDEIQSLDFFYETAMGIADLDEPPKELASNLQEIAETFGVLNITSVSGEKDLQSTLAAADFIFVHDEDSRAGLLKQLPPADHGKIKRVDKQKVQYADSFFLRFSEHFPALRKAYKKLARERAQRRLPVLRREKCYLFGTGPNLSNIEGGDFSDGLTIACNSMAINGDILDQIDPDLFVIADPIFHAGPSAYAYSFRSALVQQLRARRCPLIVPMRDFHIYSNFLPADLQERIIPIDFEDREAPILDVISEATVTTTSNILTLFQIPLAATLSKELLISGCDGRPLTSNEYFWKHNKSVQINEEMESIKRAHPAFFDISYDDYYSRHIETLEKWLSACEQTGISVKNLTPSYIPALQSRQVADLLPTVKGHRDGSPRVSIIIPSYNAAPFLEEAVKSLLDEGRSDLEVIIVDDFSDDGSFDLANDIADRFEQVFCCQNFEGKGVSGARNTGLSLARGDYVGFLDADDIIFPGSLNARVGYLSAHPDVHIVHSRLEFINDQSERLGVLAFKAGEISFNDMFGSGASLNTIMLRRRTAGAHLRFDQRLTNGEDWLAFAQVLRRGYRSHYVEGGLAAYRVHPQSTVLKNFRRHEEQLNSVIDEIYSDDVTGTAAEEFRRGLEKPARSDVVYQRRLGQLVFDILSGNVEQIDEKLGDAGFRARLAVDRREFLPMTRVPAARFSGLHIDRLGEISGRLRASLERGVSAASQYPESHRLLECIRSLFGLGSGELEAPDNRFATANRLVREGEYRLALPIYVQLYEQRPFDMYLSNARYAAKKLSVEAHSIEALQRFLKSAADENQSELQ